MSNGKIAIVVDSCTDVPEADIERFGMYVVPLQINYEKESFLDKVTISAEEVYSRLEEEVPRTSTPTPAVVGEVLDRVVADGYDQAVIVTISSGLSSTYDLLRSVATGMPHLRSVLVDSKNIGMGAGLVVLAVARMVEAGATLSDIERAVPGIVENTKVFFCVDTLDYLVRGGRIGKVTHAVGSLLDMRPVISCNEDGVYYTVAKAKGRRQSLKRMMKCAMEVAEGFDRCVGAVVNAAAQDEADAILAELKAKAGNVEKWHTGHISPALVVHAGPGMVGVGFQKILS